MILDEQAVHDLLKMEDLIPAMAKAMADLSSGKVVQPPRVMMPIAEHHGILGAGVQARSHLEALRLVRTFREVRVWSPRSAAAFAKQFGIRAAASAEEAVRGADVVVVATTSQTPVLSGAWLAPGTHINAVGAPRPTWRELDDDVLGKAKLYVESREAATLESGDVIASGR